MQVGRFHFHAAVRAGWRHRLLGAAGLVSALALILAGCGSSSSSSSSSTSSAASSSTSSQVNAAKAHPSVVPAVPTPSSKQLTLKALGKVPRGAKFAPHIVGFSGIPIAQAIPTISADINKFWSGLAAKANVQWPQVQEVLVQGSPVQTNCSGKATEAPTDPVFICTAAPNSQGQTTIYWPVTFLQQKVDTDPGRVNLALEESLVWALQVQNVTGALSGLQSGKGSKSGFAQENVCLAGVYVNSLNNRKMFEQGDSPALQSFYNNLTGTFGITSPDVTPQQLQSAFVTGFKTGDPSQCQSLLGSGGGGGGGSTTPSSTTTPSTTPATTTPGSTTT